jgi:tyrosinase
VLRAYKKGVTEMRSRPATDPTSWLAQANIHGAFSPPPGMIADACQHGNLFFQSWHRMYLYFFERIVRKASGFPNFVLPYWGYSPTGDRTLPIPFRIPANASNPLYVSQRRATINGGAPLSASAVDAGSALALVPFNSFSFTLEGTPHGVVHTGVGGPGGWMSAFETAGQDPIFWLHHANIDRLWGVWLASGGGRANPTADVAWMTTKFDFYDENGATVTMTGADVLDTAKQLDYVYGSPLCRRPLPPGSWRQYSRIPLPDARSRAAIERIRVRPPLPQPRPIAQVKSALRLGATPATVKVPLSAEARQALAQLQAEKGEGRQVLLVLEEIHPEEPPDVYYEIYVNLPDGTTPTYTSPHYVGNLDFFGPSPKSQKPHGPAVRTFTLVPALVRLRAAGRWREDEVHLTFVPRAHTERETVRAALGTRTQAVLGQITIRIE